MLRSEGRILTTHAGSLPRPAELTAMFVKKSRGEAIDEAAFASAIDEATRRVIKNQLDAGIDIGNNGEQARESFFTYVQHRMSGFGGRSNRPLMRDLVEYPSFWKIRARDLGGDMVDLMHSPKAVADITYRDRAGLEAECSQTKRIAAEQPLKFAEMFMTAPSAGIIASAMLNDHYQDYAAYVEAVGAALRIEYQYIASQNFVLQLDCPDLAMERHTSYADRSLDDFLKYVELNIATTNRAIAGIAPDRIRMHVCWGNYEAPHDLDVPLEAILPLLYEAKVGALVIEAANPRHQHEYRCFKRLRMPNSFVLVTGVIDTKTNYVEHPEVIADRLERAAEAIGDPRRVLAGTDCGFETTAGLGEVAEEIVWAKMRAMRDGADLASRRLF